jgi:hypothetical protein
MYLRSGFTLALPHGAQIMNEVIMHVDAECGAADACSNDTGAADAVHESAMPGAEPFARCDHNHLGCRRLDPE